jgi:predicted DNA-binding transcriptional regulator AlpA
MCSTRTIQRLLEVGTGPPVIHISNRRIIFRVDDVRAWLDKRRFSRRGHPQL